MLKKVKLATPPATALTPSFWKKFAKTHWERKAFLLKNVRSPLVELTDSEIFELLVLYSDRCRENHDPEGFKFFVKGSRAEAEDVLQILPVKSDGTLLGYHHRMAKLFSDYCLVCDELLRVNSSKQHLLTDFTTALYKEVGLPNRFSEMGLYLGNYRKTPFGVHVDACGVFSFPVAGKKNFRIWSAAYAEKNPDLDRSFQYNKHLAASTLLEACPGDMTYWPSADWHIAESDGSFNATWSLGVWVDRPQSELFFEGLSNALSNQKKNSLTTPMTAFQKISNSDGEVTELPEGFKASLRALKNLTRTELEDAFLDIWMTHASSQGFKTLPQNFDLIKTSSQLRLRDKNARVLWRKSLTQPGPYFLSFGGVKIVNLKSEKLLNLVKDINAGKTCQISSYLKGPQKQKDLGTLQKLADAGAFKA